MTSVLFINILFAQENSISKEKWNTIVDYTNAKVTLAYIDDLHEKSNPSKEDNVYYNNILRPQLSNASIESSISFDSMSILMKPHFEKTLNNLSFKINEIRNEPRDLETLFSSIEAALKTVKRDNLDNSKTIIHLRSEIMDFTKFTNLTDVQQSPVASAVLDEPEEIRSERGNSLFTLTNLIKFVLFIVFIFFVFLSINKHKMIENLEEDKKELKKELTWYKANNHEISAYQSQIKKLKETISNQEQQLTKINATDSQGDMPAGNDLRRVNTIPLETPKSMPISKSFYCGKPTPNRTFERPTNDIIEQETIFKFTYAEQNMAIANFEVLIVSDFMKRQMINSPDDFLYRMCNNANSNQDFTKEIITERQGVAHLKDGIWIVDENDKALIRFQ